MLRSENEVRRRDIIMQAVSDALQRDLAVRAAAQSGVLGSNGDAGSGGTVGEDGSYAPWFRIDDPVDGYFVEPDFSGA